jgi:hypothetical protein
MVTAFTYSPLGVYYSFNRLRGCYGREPFSLEKTHLKIYLMLFFSNSLPCEEKKPGITIA